MTRAVVIRAPAGLGKTSLVVKALAHGTGGPAEVYVPTHALAEEVGRDLRDGNPQLKVNVIAGRSHPGTGGKPLCKKHKVAEEVARAGGEVRTKNDALQDYVRKVHVMDVVLRAK